MAEDIDRFIQEQKSKLARERNEMQQESARKVLEPASTSNSGAGINGFKENIPPNDKALPAGSHDNLKNRLAKERQEEYQMFLAEKEKQSAQRSQPQALVDGASLNIPNRESEKDRSKMARNKEYNEFLKNKGGNTSRKPRVGNEELSPGITHRGGHINPITGEAMTVAKPTPPGQSNGHPPPDLRAAAPSQDRLADSQIRREAGSQTPRPILRDYDDRPPPGPPVGPRRGWGSPQPDYDDILRRKREEEARYRRYDEDLDYYPPRGGMRPSNSDPHLNRYPPEDGRYSRARHDYYDQEYDRRRVRFSDERNPNDRGYPPPGNTRYDGPPMDRPLANRPPGDGRDVLNEPSAYDWNISRGGRSRTLPEIDRQRSNGSRAEDYTDGKSPRAKSATSSNEEVGIAIGKRDSASATRRKKEQYRMELEQQMKEVQEAKKREKQKDLHMNATVANDQAKQAQGYASSRGPSRTPVPNQQQAGAQPAGYQPSFLNQGYPSTGQGPSAYPPASALGLEEAITKARLGEAPMIERPFTLNTYQPQLSATSTDPYMYYGVRNPMDPDPAAFAYRMMQPPVSLNTTYPSTYNALPGAGVLANNAPPDNLSLLNASKTAQIRGESSIKNFVGDTNLSPRSLNDPKDYQAMLRQQMMEKETKKRFEKEEQERYDAKLEAQAAEYNPWGKGGGGAPMRDNKGKIVADLRKLHNHNEQALNNPAGTHEQLYADQPLTENTSAAATVTADRSSWPGATDPQPVTTASKDPKDEYKEYLKQQVEDKKRREVELKEKIRLEEEKEERRLEEQRVKMQRDFELEQQRIKEKEEEKKRHAQDLERKIEEQKKEAQKKKHDAMEARRREGEEDRRTQEQSKIEQERYSPPIPALRNKGNPPRQSSPPIPTLRKKKENEIKDSPRTANAIHETSRNPPEGNIYNRPNLKEKQSAWDNPQTKDNHNAYPKSDDNISSPWNELSPPQTPQKEEQKWEKENPMENRREYSQGPTGKTLGENAAPSPVEKWHVHKLKEEDEPGDGRQGKDVQESQRKPVEKPGKSSEFELVDWLRSVDPDLAVYAPALSENGYKTIKAVRRMSRHTLLQFCPDMKHGHVEALLHEVDRMQTPASKQEQESAAKDGVDGAGRDPRDVMTALSAMRRQLHSEQRRIQSQLDRNKEHDPYSGPKHSTRRASPQVDIFEIARHKAPVAVRREPLSHAAAAEFSSLKNRESNSRQRLREQFPDQPSSDLTLEAQQRVLLRHQQNKLDNLRRAKTKRPLEEQMPGMDPRDLGRNDSPLLPLESDSAFIGIANGIADIPNTPPYRKRPPSPRRNYGQPSTSKPKDPLGSTMSFDNDTIDYLAQKNRDRNKALKQLETDNTSLVDPDDVLQMFMTRDSYDRPKSGKSENLSLWLQPTVDDY